MSRPSACHGESTDHQAGVPDRRRLLALIGAGLVGGAAVLAGCAGPPPPPRSATGTPGRPGTAAGPGETAGPSEPAGPGQTSGPGTAHASAAGTGSAHPAPAAAATGIGMVATGAPLSRRSLVVDRPFLYWIADTVTGVPLFPGTVTDPTA